MRRISGRAALNIFRHSRASGDDRRLPTPPGINDDARRRWSVAFRIVAGTIGAYALTSLTTAAFSLLLNRAGMDRVEAVTTATLGSFAFFAVIAMAAFHARSALRAWAWLLALSLLPALGIFLMMPGGQP